MKTPGHQRRLQPDQKVILVAEDENIVRTVICASLERQGHMILPARDGLEALQISRHFPGFIDLLVTDITMPKMDGMQLCQHLKTERPDTEILVISGDRHPNMEYAFLAKPFDIRKLQEQTTLLLASDCARESGKRFESL